MFRLASERDALEGFVISLSRDDITSFVGEVCNRGVGINPCCINYSSNPCASNFPCGSIRVHFAPK